MSVTEQIDNFINEHSGNTGNPLLDTRDALNIALAKLELYELEAQSRQLLAASESETTRLLATKFVADEAVGLVVELVAALKLALAELNEYANGVEQVEAPGLFYAVEQTKSALAKAAQFTAAATATTVGGETETQIFPPVEPE